MSLESVLYFYAHVNHTLVHLMNRNQSGETSEVFLVQLDYPMIKKKVKPLQLSWTVNVKYNFIQKLDSALDVLGF